MDGLTQAERKVHVAYIPYFVEGEGKRGEKGGGEDDNGSLVQVSRHGAEQVIGNDYTDGNVQRQQLRDECVANCVSLGLPHSTYIQVLFCLCVVKYVCVHL